jgi:hypothetical protein
VKKVLKKMTAHHLPEAHFLMKKSKERMMSSLWDLVTQPQNNPSEVLKAFTVII